MHEDFLHHISAHTNISTDQLLHQPSKQDEHIIFQSNSTKTPYPESCCVHDLFAAQVSKTPHAIALKDPQHALTYDELNTKANQLATYLLEQGAGPEIVVGLYLERSVLLVIGLLAILKAGAAYVPLDPAYPQERLAFMLSHSEAQMILTQTHLQSSFSQWTGQTICLDRADTAIWERVTTSLSRRTLPHNLAYIMYTSGSTGQPKGVMITHQNLNNYLHWCLQRYINESMQGSVVHSSIGFDLTITSLFVPLLSGQSASLLPEDRNATALSQLLNTSKNYSLLKITPSHLALLKEQMKTGETTSQTTTFVIGGEALTQQEISFWKNYAPKALFINEYGPTEATVGCCTYVCEGQLPELETGTVPIGKPIFNTQLYILNEQLQPVPIGTWGELYISGHGLARGYHKSPELTAERFLPNPFNPDPLYSRMYKTGDIGRYLLDGQIEFKGRNDLQIKLHGFRIELEEIEMVLRKHPAIQGSLVQIVNGENASQEVSLAAYIVSKQGSSIENSELLDFLRKHLPDYMIPEYIVQLPVFPLTVHGKIDRQKLPNPHREVQKTQKEHIPPRDLLELQLVQLWEQVLHTYPIGITDDFFTLGGHSFLAVRLTRLIKKRFGHDVPLKVLFEQPTVDHLARALRQPDLIAKQQIHTVKLKPDGTRKPFFFVHPIGGTVLPYFELAHAMDKEQPFYAFQATGLYGECHPLTTIEDMANIYIQSMQSIDLEGPYLLGGWSMGAIVALEMAQQLQKSGKTVALLAMLDCQVPGSSKDISHARQMTDFIVHLLSSFSSPLPSFKQFDMKYIENLYHRLQKLPQEQQIELILAQVKQAGVIPADVDPEQFAHLIDVFCANYRAVRSYHADSYTGPVIFISSEEVVKYKGLGPAMGWDHLLMDSMELHTLPGDHYDLMKQPTVCQVAKKLSATASRVCEGDFNATNI